MLSAQSQCLLRQADLYSQGKWLFVNPADAHVFSQLPANTKGFFQYYDQYLQAKQLSQHEHAFGAIYPTDEKFDGIMLYLPKAKKQAVWLLKHLAGLLVENGLLCIVGENKGGIKSSGKLLEAHGDKANKIESAKHCSVYAIQVTKAASFELDSARDWFSASVNEHALTMATVPGVFSHGELDAGTQLLLENVTRVPDGNILDFACGNGVIGQYLHQLNPGIELTLSDASALALYCAQQTMQRANITADIIASNGLHQVGGSFNAIYSNPPFHTGLANDYQITQQFIRDAAKQLRPGGELWLVANRFLPYPEHLQRHFGRFGRPAETSKFVLYHCTK